MIPKSIRNEIVSRVNKDWPDDPEMQTSVISDEVEAYAKLEDLALDEHQHIKTELIESARAILDSWVDIYDDVESEIHAYREFEKYSVDGVPATLIDEWKVQAKNTTENTYSLQLEFLRQATRKHLFTLSMREKLDPIKGLLIELEKIVGSECYNANIQNYEAWGELESEGRQFRYPVTFQTEKRKIRRRTVPQDTPSEKLITGYYAFGANELNIFRALAKVVFHLRDKHGLKV